MRKRISERVSEAWGIPKDVIMNIPRLTISGDKEIYIENHKGILQYTDTEIRISTPMGIVHICGKSLLLERIRLEDILISGTFERIEYEI
ncbi:MAG: sporulation protein YqfC [Clostridia bacterium]|jgi:sporulation protein YqfC|nr:sporulation protein YqfC [Clostridia bacterium]MCI8979511.1 sporulation protein YqfC [Clostridia bacterium]MCI9085438.1 sporulation protein YqfC [Clostridia bacterium]NDO19798.1 sporulation protein YqfC [Lachnospiraceae bacterium MD329]